MHDSPLLQLFIDSCLVISSSRTKESMQIDGHNLQLVIQLDGQWSAFLSKEAVILKDWPNAMLEYLVVEPELWIIILEVLTLST